MVVYNYCIKIVLKIINDYCLQKHVLKINITISPFAHVYLRGTNIEPSVISHDVF